MNEQENKHSVQQFYHSQKTGDIQSLLNSLARDVQWELPEMENVPFAGKWRTILPQSFRGTGCRRIQAGGVYRARQQGGCSRAVHDANQSYGQECQLNVGARLDGRE